MIYSELCQIIFWHLECCVRLAYREPYHIQNFAIFRSLAYLKGYFCYKMITSQTVQYDAQIKNFLFCRKVMFRSQDIQDFVFLTIS